MGALTSYQTLLGLSQEMSLLANQQAWEKLAELEARRTILIASLPSRLDVLPHVEQQAISAIIKQILICDGMMQEYIAPWHEQVGTLLARLAPKP
ncbi:MAG: flagellar protein FliT [Burkholderiaceae bacterium]|nr:flagellar protein FliT [Burkholderiaceae bacterium]